MIILRWHLNVLSLGDHEAKTLGLNVDKIRLILIVCSTLTVSTAVAVSGIIGWVGLMIPHLVRMLIGPDHKQLVPYSIFLGAAFLIGADTLARSVSNFDIPVGVVTAMAGAPFFLLLLSRSNRSRWA
jgi:iron complex transport system permease protein